MKAEFGNLMEIELRGTVPGPHFQRASESAFGGVENVRAAYAHAIAKRYRFYSYGDAMLIEKAG